VVPKKLNVNQSRDPGDRYWMHQLLISVSGRGRHAKTTLVNIKQVASELRVNPEFLTTFIGAELGTTAKYDGEKGSKKPMAVISTDVDAGILAETLQIFIQKFVLCPTCGLPEISLQPSSCSSSSSSPESEIDEITEKLKRLETGSKSNSKRTEGNHSVGYSSHLEECLTLVKAQSESFIMNCRGCGARSPLRVKNKLLRKYMIKNADNLGVSGSDDFGVSSACRIASLDVFSTPF